MGGPPEELRNGLLDDTRRQSSRTNSTRVVASMQGSECYPDPRQPLQAGTITNNKGHFRPNPLERHPNTDTRVKCK
ncbi:unnamed protein product [Boreogadus saida]